VVPEMYPEMIEVQVGDKEDLTDVSFSLRWYR
jgi:hypothetical protein